jgi:hypothetical protein
MKHSWLRGAPFLLLGLADMALSGYLLWAGGRAVFRADGPPEVSLGGIVALLGVGAGAVGLPMFWASWRAGGSARRPLSRPLLALLFLVGALPWLGVAAERLWPEARTAPDRVQIVCVMPEGTDPAREVGKVVLREHSSGELFFDSIFEPQSYSGSGFIYVIEPPRGSKREFPMACSPPGSRCTPLEASEADLRQVLGLLRRCES